MNPMRQMALATAALPVARHHRPVTLSGTHHSAVGEMTVGHRLHAALVGTHRAVGEMTVVHHLHRPRAALVATRPVVDEMTVGHHLLHHAVFVGTRRVARRSAMTAGRHRRRLALVGMTTTVAVMVEIVVSPLRGIVDAATRFLGLLRPLVGVTSGSVSVHRRPHVEKAHVTGTGTVVHVLLPVPVLVIMIVGEMIHGIGTGIADADADGLSLTLCVRLVDMFRNDC